YGATVDALTTAIQLDAPSLLVVGQTSVVADSAQVYFVKSGDSLYSIAQKFNMTYQELARINNFPVGNLLPVGFRLYIPEQPKRQITSLAYIEPRGDTVSQTLQNAATKTSPYLTYLAHFSYTINR